MRRCIILIATAIALWGCGNSDEGKKGDEAAQPSSQAEHVEKTADGQQRVSYRPDTAVINNDKAVNPASTMIVISKKELRLYVISTANGDTTVLARYPVCLSRNKGQKEKSGDMRTPESAPGKPFTIKQIQDASTWVHDFGDGRGPILAYGKWFMRLETPFNGIGIHGSTGNENSVPGRDSEGCIRLRDNDLIHLKEHYAQVGMPVVILAEEAALPFRQ